MAGIGFELKKIYGRKTLTSNLRGTLYATMLTIGPTVLSAVLMLILNTLLSWSGLTVLEGRFFISSTTYAFLSALLITSFFSTPVSRYIADCIYLRRESEIFPSAFGVLAFTTAISGIVMSPSMRRHLFLRPGSGAGDLPGGLLFPGRAGDQRLHTDELRLGAEAL